jgi:hypothetical protein
MTGTAANSAKQYTFHNPRQYHYFQEVSSLRHVLWSCSGRGCFSSPPLVTAKHLGGNLVVTLPGKSNMSIDTQICSSDIINLVDEETLPDKWVAVTLTCAARNRE